MLLSKTSHSKLTIKLITSTSLEIFTTHDLKIVDLRKLEFQDNKFWGIATQVH